MKLTGSIHTVVRDFKTKKPVISFLLNEDPNGLENLIDKNLSIDIHKVSKPRSLNSNAYFHVLCGQLAIKNKVSMNYQKNDLIAEWGQPLFEGENKGTIKTNIPPEQMLELAEPHMKYMKTGEDGTFWYTVYRGSHTYSVSEMHELIEGTVLRCMDAGVPVATPDERAHMEELWKREINRRGMQHDNSRET